MAEGHSPANWNPVGFYFGSEAHQSLQDFISETGWDDEIASKLTVKVNHTDTPVRFFICADHQAHIKLGEATSPSGHAARCPFCSTDWKELEGWKQGCLPVKEACRAGTLLPAIVPVCRPFDILHGVAVTTATLHNYTTTLLEYGKKKAASLTEPELPCCSSLNQWHSYVLEGRFLQLDFHRSQDGPHLEELWGLHQLICATLLEHGDPPPAKEHLLDTCTAVCSPACQHFTGHRGGLSPRAEGHPLAAPALHPCP